MKHNPNPAKVQKRISGHLKTVNLYAAGIDIGSEFHFVAVPKELDEQSVRSFACFTSDLEMMTQWLVKIGITTVVMESTGIYWIPAFEMLEEHGLDVKLVNARHVKNVPGRKSDVQDCQWLQQLHTHGLLEGAFRPEDQVCALRAYMRQRETLIRYRASHIQHMQKALRQMNLLLDNVVADITGKTGMGIILSILAGERDPEVLAKHRDSHCKKSEKVIAKSLHGHYRVEHLFALKQSVELYDFYEKQIEACDKALEDQLNQFDDKSESISLPAKRKSASAPAFDVRTHLYRVTGVDLTSIEGIEENTALKVVSEIGTDMSRWPTVKHFCSWLGLSPGNKISGGKVLSSKTKRIPNRAASALRMAALTLVSSKSALGAYYRRMRSKLGAPKAITATAHKLARLIYSMLKNGSEYVDRGQDYYEEQYRDRVIKNMRKRAEDMGYKLVEIETAAPS
ncbi:IS110 family transposase [Endozoicomonas gorgoniicola]|uniref:IS110 family transposase n=1 Tax=Endozoicomonas gorgoniicola TaxID=1234144 RepID=A0ABT3MQP4_9GAMM|nr:IS110 family transposase [Endozoicomonas gorgoniicola]MCW7551672.1 IS110 family transposase [Endozoicomonas gorgoniicola]